MGRIFISYRRDGGAELARLVRDALEQRGYSVFIDVEDLRSGPFNTALYQVIEAATDVLVILTPNCLDRCQNADDWVRLEIAHAFKCKKNIIPVTANGFEWPAQSLPDDICDLPMQHGLAPSIELFKASMDKLADMLHARPLFWRKHGRTVKTVATAIMTAILLPLIWYLYKNTEPIPRQSLPQAYQQPLAPTQIATPSNAATSVAPVVTKNIEAMSEQRANAAWIAKNYAAAFDAYAQLSDADVTNVGFHRRIEECARLGHLGKPFLERYAALTQKEPNNAIFHNYFGNACLMIDPTDKDGKARAEYETALRLDPKLASPLANLGIIAFRAGKSDEAESYFKRYLAVEPNDAACWVNLGLLYTARVRANARDTQAASAADAAFHRALQIEPGSPSAYKGLGRLFAATDRKQDALDAYQRSYAFDDAQPDVRQQIELLAWDSSGTRVPATESDDLKTRGMNQSTGTVPAAVAAMKRFDARQFPQAEAVCLEWTRAEPQNPLAWRLLGRAYDAQGRAEDARAAYAHVGFILKPNKVL